MTEYKGRRAISLDAGNLRALVLPDDGGKIASLTDGRHEFLCQDAGARYRTLAPDGVYVDAECAGFDDMFPTVDPCFDYPDHGEVCRHPHEVSWEADALTLTYRAKKYLWRKTLSARDGALSLRYEVRANEDLDALWAGHMMLAGAPDMRLETPFAQGAPLTIMFSSDEAAHAPGSVERFGESPDHVSLRPFARDGLTYKYYFQQPSPKGEYAVRYPSWETALFLRFDTAEIPYAGVWCNSGAFQEKYNLALELCTAPYDRPDRAKGARVRIAKDTNKTFTLTVSTR